MSISLSSPTFQPNAEEKRAGAQLKRPAGGVINDTDDASGSRMHAKRMRLGAIELVEKMKSSQQLQQHTVQLSLQ